MTKRSNNRLAKVTDSDGEIFSFSYDGLGRRTRLNYANGCYATYDYDSKSQLLTVNNLDSRNRTISSYSYTHDKAGNRINMLEADGTTHAYGYDATYQLTDWMRRDKKGGKEYHFQYTYDPVGNRIGLKKQTFGRDNPKTDDWWDHPSHSYVYDTANQLTEIRPGNSAGKSKGKSSGNPWTVTFEYDANGNQISKTDQHGTTACEYDYQNLLKKITYPDGTENTFQNCRCGPVRRMKQDSTGTTKYLYDFDETHLLHECDENWTPNTHYTLGPRIDEILKKKYLSGASWKSVYYHCEGIGSVRTLTDENGNVLGRYEYEPFGKILAQPEDLDNNFTFQGREWDRDSGLYYFRARYMDPRLGRFTSKDPLKDMLIQNRSGNMGMFTSGSSCGNGCSSGFLSRDPIGEFGSRVSRDLPQDILIQRSEISESIFISESASIPSCGNGCSVGHRYYIPERFSLDVSLQKIGPNIYCYVGNNPQNWCDPLGLGIFDPADWINLPKNVALVKCLSECKMAKDANIKCLSKMSLDPCHPGCDKEADRANAICAFCNRIAELPDFPSIPIPIP